MASRVLPRFQPGFMFAMKAEALIGVKAVGQAAAVEVVTSELVVRVVDELTVVVLVVVGGMVVELVVALVVVVKVVDAVPGTHCE